LDLQLGGQWNFVAFPLYNTSLLIAADVVKRSPAAMAWFREKLPQRKKEV
jgi:hypothetical protein